MSAPDRSAWPLKLVPPPDEEPPRSVAELVVALQNGRSEAARAIWDRHSGSVYRFLARALGPGGQEIEDLTQEVFLRIFSRAAAIRHPAALREFAQSVAVRVLKWELRRRWVRRRVHLTDSGELPEPATEERQVAEEAEARHALRRCYRILETLGARQRAAFSLRYMEGMTMEEVAARMDVSISTAKRLVSRSAAIVAAQVESDRDMRRFFATREPRGPREE
jgi:RNA polymerase sigma-70 factor (ECF subfamily)